MEATEAARNVPVINALQPLAAAAITEQPYSVAAKRKLKKRTIWSQWENEWYDDDEKTILTNENE